MDSALRACLSRRAACRSSAVATAGREPLGNCSLRVQTSREQFLGHLAQKPNPYQPVTAPKSRTHQRPSWSRGGPRGLHAHFCCPSMRETSFEVGEWFWSAVGARFGGRRVGLFAGELIIGGVLLIGAVPRTRLPLPSRVLEIVCARAAALEQNTTPAISTTFFVALIAKVSQKISSRSSHGLPKSIIWEFYRPARPRYSSDSAASAS
jgi:hypothetical protein